MHIDKIDPEFPKITENDKRVLKKIIDAKKISDSDIAKSLNLSPQAIFKIRNKLESIGIIKGYIPIIDYKKIGISVIVVLVIKVASNIWNNITDEQMSERIASVSYM
jgi:DNA-binding Lrp family transcriptional regulator